VGERARFDVVVLGGGSAGCALAARLSEDADRRVCLVEAGPDYGAVDDGRWPAEILDARVLPFSHLWEIEEGDRSSSRARIIGGCSAHNNCAVVWGSPADYDEWGEAASGWSFAVLTPYLRRAETQLETRRFREVELAPWHRAMLEAGRALDFPLVDDPNDPEALVCVAPYPANARESVRWNASFAYLDPARARSNLTILAETLADRVLLEPGRARGAIVRREGRAVELVADTVVVAASAYGSPAILLRSGIGPEDALRRLGIRVVAALPEVGANLVDHPGVGVGWEPTDLLQTETARHDESGLLFEGASLVKARSSRCERDSWDLHVLPWTNPERDELGQPTGRYEISAAVFAVKPRSQGRLRLRSVDPLEPPSIEHGFLSDPTDLAVLVEGVELVRRLGACEPAGAFARRETRPGPAADVEGYVREQVRGYFHPVGTCALGSVVDARGRVLGFDNLYVADASIMPTIPRANTNLTTIAIAERIADLIKM
jgi:choline dehydrogenase-like flavoprotein